MDITIDVIIVDEHYNCCYVIEIKEKKPSEKKATFL